MFNNIFSRKNSHLFQFSQRHVLCFRKQSPNISNARLSPLVPRKPKIIRNCSKLRRAVDWNEEGEIFAREGRRATPVRDDGGHGECHGFLHWPAPSFSAGGEDRDISGEGWG